MEIKHLSADMGRRVAGASLVGLAGLLAIPTAEAAFGDDRRPDALVLQDTISSTVGGNETGDYSNGEIALGLGLNTAAAAGLAGAGLTLALRGRRDEGTLPPPQGP